MGECWAWGATEPSATNSSLSTQSPGPQAVLRWPWQLRELGVITSSSHNQAQSVCLCKNRPEQASGGEPISPSQCEVFAGRKTINVSAMRRKLQLYLLEQHWRFSKAPRAQHLGFSATPQKCVWREMTSGEQSLRASLLSSQEGEMSYQLFSTSWWPVLPLEAATQRVWCLLCPLQLRFEMCCLSRNKNPFKISIFHQGWEMVGIIGKNSSHVLWKIRAENWAS